MYCKFFCYNQSYLLTTTAMIKKDKTQLLRLIFIDRKIREGMRSGNYANCISLSREYEVSSKSIQRDIDYLKNQCDAPIEYDSSKKGFYYSEENYKMPAVNISASDLFALCIAEKVLKQHEDTPIYRKLVSVFKKIEESLPETTSIHPSWVDSRISIIQHSKTTITPKIWGIVSDALQRNRTINITYRKPSENFDKNRKIDPYHLVNFQGEWYLVGYCHLRKKILTFSVSRMKDAKIIKGTFSIPSDFNYQKATTRFGIFNGDQEYGVKILFDKKHAPYVLEREWHPSQKISSKPDGSILFEITTNHLFEIKQWIMSWGHGVKVITPTKLRDDIRQELHMSLSQYT